MSVIGSARWGGREAAMVLMLGAWMALASPSFCPAQSDPPEPKSGDAAPSIPSTDDADERALVRARLSTRLELAKRQVERLEGLLKRLDAGGNPEEIRRESAGPLRSRMRDEFDRPQGPPGGPMGPGGPPGGGRPRPGDGPPMDRPPPRDGGRDGPDGRAIMDFIERRAPEFADRLRDVRDHDPGAFDRIIDRLRGRAREIIGEPDEELQRLRIDELRGGFESMLVLRTLRRAVEDGGVDSPDTQRAIARLREETGRLYDTRRKVHEREVATLQGRVDRLKAQLQEQRPTREEFIEGRVAEALDAIKQMRPPRPDDDALDAGRPRRPDGPPR